MLKGILYTSAIFLFVSIATITAKDIDGFVFDPDAKLKTGLNGSRIGGYRIQVILNPKYPYIYFQDTTKKNFTYAGYNWKFQYWVWKNIKFNDNINPADLFEKISLDQRLLQRKAPAKEIQEKLQQYSTGSSPFTSLSKDKKQENTRSDDGGFNFDPGAVPNPAIKELNGYRIVFVQPIKIRDQILFWSNSYARPVASFNWKKQVWNYINQQSGFDSSRIDLEKLFLKISLSRDEMDRVSPSENYKTKTQIKLEKLSEDQDSGWSDYDHNAKVNPAVKFLGAYRVKVDQPLTSGQVFFYSTKPGKEKWMLANYDWQKQYWKWTLKQFRADEVDLKKLFISVNRSRNELNRSKPKDLSIWNYSHLEKQKYNASANSSFRSFLLFLDTIGVSADVKMQYLRWANNPAKLGGRYKYRGQKISPVKLGYFPQYLIKTPEKYYEFYNPRIVSPTHIAGGMSYYLTLGYGSFTTISSPVQYIYKKHNPVPITLVEIFPANKKKTDTISLSNLKKELKRLLKSVYYKDFTITVKSIVANYQEMQNVPKDDDTTLHRLKFLDKYVHSRFGHDKIYIYYFTDAQAFARIDRHLSHPVLHGVYFANWNKTKMTLMHEFGHALGLYHHFGKREQAGKPGAHISSPCIMNYRAPYKSNTICPLCRYALEGIPQKK